MQMLEGRGKIYRSGKAFTMFISVPADVVKDGAFPFNREKGEYVLVRTDGKRLLIEKVK